MIAYFGYGSNINFIALKAKGVIPIRSERGILYGYHLKFNVEHWFKHEGGMGNVVKTGNPKDSVEGMVHFISENQLQLLDAMESYGVGYDRIEVGIQLAGGTTKAVTYVGLPDFLNDACLPTRRYLNIILEGANTAGLSAEYIEKIKVHPILPLPDYPTFKPPNLPGNVYDEAKLALNQHLTALAGYVFDLTNASEKLQAIKPLFGGKDMTMFHLKRHDSSDGKETLQDFLNGNITAGQNAYINAYLNEYNKHFDYAGTFSYEN